MTDFWVCYLILAEESSQTYVGASNNPINRLKNHNSNRGAKRTKGQTWSHVLIVSGFDCKQSCLSFEAGWKRLSKYRNNKKLANLIDKSDIELKYTNHTVWNRLLDLMFFTYNFTFIGTKFIQNKDLKNPVCHPDKLTITYHMADTFNFITDLTWPKFIKLIIL